ncbi:ubiquinone biosynthesis O-methyltransferase [Terasakiella brassicae]|uniref:Ubiquinone biosynthesis O-methyltransferase n=1 Tax=Terasakiella brassicae TaxID=1634917 RepID=A0A917FFR8_9PROT|nr:bifunctional 2-polyprenyl-6-hydroxyphenol methylase/3-demethylubiquinol 3-O-methyltransferase UbiG [Terasakiella brassicae]GGF71569.1 ubiquinone biosynthesis O-methyltransferase [Terasakiella brassicae]
MASTTVNPEEVAWFTAIADEWWDPNGKFRPLHKFNPTRLAFIRERLCDHFGLDENAEQPLKGLRLLDIGCGGGLISEPLCRMGAEMTSIDAGDKNIKTAIVHAEAGGLDIDYRCVFPEDLAKEGLQFDGVLNMEVIEHVADIDAFLEASCALIKPGGAMIGATLNRTIKSFAMAKVGAEYILRWLPRGTHDFNKFVKPGEFADGLRQNGLNVIQMKGMTFNPLRDSWSLTDDLSVNYLLFATKQTT